MKLCMKQGLLLWSLFFWQCRKHLQEWSSHNTLLHDIREQIHILNLSCSFRILMTVSSPWLHYPQLTIILNHLGFDSIQYNRPKSSDQAARLTSCHLQYAWHHPVPDGNLPFSFWSQHNQYGSLRSSWPAGWELGHQWDWHQWTGMYISFCLIVSMFLKLCIVSFLAFTKCT